MEHHPECTTKELEDTHVVYLNCHDDCPVLAEVMKQALKDYHKVTSVPSLVG